MKSVFIFLTIAIFCALCSCTKKSVEQRNRSNYLYKIPVDLKSGEIEYHDKLVSLAIDFEEKLKESHSAGKKINFNSIRIDEVDSAGNFIDSCTVQYDIDKLLWLAKGITPQFSTRHFIIYFNSTDQHSVIAEQKPLVTIKDTADNWAFTTPNGFFVYEKSGGAFNVFAPEECADNEKGKDWVRGDYKEYNGILNVGAPDTKAIFHPHKDVEADDGIWGGSKSEIIFSGPLHYQVRSINRFGNLHDDYRSNTEYRIVFDIYPNYIKATVEKGNEHGYACVIEMTPGGDSLELSDYVIGSDGRKFLKGDTLAADMSPEWMFAGDAQDSSTLFFIHKQDDDIIDGIHWYDFMQGLMLGWGRGANPGINTYPNEFFMGFSKQSKYADMKKLVASISNQPELIVHKMVKQDLNTWGSIDIKKNDNQYEVALENTVLKLTYSLVNTANAETAITELLIKSKGVNVSGKHMDEMARSGTVDRGGLSDRTAVIYEDENKKVVHLEWDDGKSIEEVTLFKDKPFIKIDYLKMYLNICDMGNEAVFADGQYKIYGAEKWKEIRLEKLKTPGYVVDENPHSQLTADVYPKYPNPLLGDWELSKESNPMNYNGWYILSVYSPSKGVGYGRVIPVEAVDHIKLLNTQGFEQFPYWFNQKKHEPFSEYVFVFTDEQTVFDLGKEIIKYANDASWYQIDSANHSIQNSLIEVGYGPDKITEGNRLTGLGLFKYKPANINLANSLDAYGYDYATYYKNGTASFEISHTGNDYVEITTSHRSSKGNEVLKKERIFKDQPIWEIEYQKLDLLWWEDFYTLENEKDRVYTMLGVNEEITSELHDKIRKTAEAKCNHNFGDCYIRAAGSTIEKSTYKGYFIFGFYDAKTKIGLGFVLPKAIGLHDGFKLWSMHNYESFPFYNTEKKLPIKRWIYAVSNGKEEIISLGKSIVDSKL